MKHLIIIFIVATAACSSPENNQFTKQDKAFFNALKANDVALKTPVDGEWLYEHKEPGQTFEEYKNASPVRITKNKNTIELGVSCSNAFRS